MSREFWRGLVAEGRHELGAFVAGDQLLLVDLIAF